MLNCTIGSCSIICILDYDNIIINNFFFTTHHSIIKIPRQKLKHDVFFFHVSFVMKTKFLSKIHISLMKSKYIKNKLKQPIELKQPKYLEFEKMSMST